MYIEDLRDKTLRGLEGRARAGFATGNVAFGYHTVPIKDARGEVIGNRIEIQDGEAKIIIRIFREYRDGKSLAAIAAGLNRDDIPSPRVGSRHTAFGCGQSTIRAMLRNERYFGIWRFKVKQWVKVPGTNKRRPRPRNPDEVIVQARPELRIIEAPLWDAVQEQLAVVAKRSRCSSWRPTRRRRRPSSTRSSRRATRPSGSCPRFRVFSGLCRTRRDRNRA